MIWDCLRRRHHRRMDNILPTHRFLKCSDFPKGGWLFLLHLSYTYGEELYDIPLIVSFQRF